MSEGLGKYLKPEALPGGRSLEGNSLRRYLTEEDLARAGHEDTDEKK